MNVLDVCPPMSGLCTYRESSFVSTIRSKGRPAKQVGLVFIFEIHGFIMDLPSAQVGLVFIFEIHGLIMDLLSSQAHLYVS